MTGRTNAAGGVRLPELTNPAGAAQILSGYEAINADGEAVTGTIPSQGAQTITPGTSAKTIAAGRYLSGAQTIAGDADLVPGNIKSGVNIFGVSGSYEGAAPITEDISESATTSTKILLGLQNPAKEICGMTLETYVNGDVCIFAYPNADSGKLIGAYFGYGLASVIEVPFTGGNGADQISIDFSSVASQIPLPSLRDAWVTYIPA